MEEIQIFSIQMLIVTRHKKTFVRYFFVAFLYFSFLGNNIFAAVTATDTLAQTDITRVGMNLYTTARKWEDGVASGYTADALKGFAKKLNSALKQDARLSKLFGKGYCDGCDSIVSDGLDQGLTTYLRNNPPRKTSGEYPYISVVKTYLDSRVLTAMDTSDIRAFDVLVSSMVDNITGQVLEQMNAFRDVSGMGLYYDGDTDNSPYDLLDDVRRIDEIFFREAPEFGGYKNSSANDASALITGKVSAGTWGGGENYNIDLLSDVSNALGKKSGSSSGGGASGNGELAGDCSSGYCIKIDFIQNSHYFLGSGAGGKGKNSFQGIFEEGLDWIIKNGDNRNFACKVSPTINTWESEFDLNVMLKNLFSSGIHVFWKTPPFLQGFATRNNANTASADTGSTATAASKTKESKQVLDSLGAAFKRRGMDFDKPTNIKGSLSQAVEYVTTKNAQTNVPVSETVYAVNRSETDIEQLLLAEGSGIERPFIHEKNVGSIKHMEKTFDEMTVRTRMFYDLTKTMKTIFDYLLSKDDCQAA